MFTLADESLTPGSSLLLLNGPPWRLVPRLPAFRPASFYSPLPQHSNLDRWPRLETRGRKSMAHTTTCYLHHGPILWRLLARLATALRATDWGVILETLRYPLKLLSLLRRCYIDGNAQRTGSGAPAQRPELVRGARNARRHLLLLLPRQRLWAYWMRLFGVGLALLGWRSPFDAQDNMQIQSNGGEAGRTGSDEEGRGGSGFLCQ